MRTPLVIRLPTAVRAFQAAMMLGFCVYTVWRSVDGGMPTFLVPAAVVVVAFARMLLLMVRADAEGLFVRNRVATRRIPWADVEGFRGDKRVHVLLRDGSMLPLEATQRRAGAVGDLVRQLEARRPH